MKILLFTIGAMANAALLAHRSESEAFVASVVLCAAMILFGRATADAP